MESTQKLEQPRKMEEPADDRSALRGLHVLWVHLDSGPRGGARRYVSDTASEMREAGSRCTLLHSGGRYADADFLSNFDEAFPYVDPVRQVREIAPDVVYVHKMAALAPIGPLTGLSVPVLKFFHDHRLFCLREHKYTTLSRETCTRTVGPGCYPCLGFLQRTGRWPGIGLRTLGQIRGELEEHRALDGYIVGSRYMKRHVESHGFDPEQIHIVPPFVKPVPELEPVERDPHDILFVGALLRGKGIDLLLDALVQIPAPARLEIVGSGHQEGLVREQVDRLGLGDRVAFRGMMSRDELHESYRRAACVVVPSRSPETFCYIGPEAMLHATPVVANDSGGVGEWLQHGENGLAVPPGDTAALAAAIRSLLDDPGKARSLGERGREICRERFRPEKHIGDLARVFRRVASRNGG